MTATIISLLSILAGITGANLTILIAKKYYFGLVGNTIAGVFGGVLLIKSFGRLGFDPASIVASGSTDYLLFLLNMITSFIGGALSVIAMTSLKRKLGSIS